MYHVYVRGFSVDIIFLLFSCVRQEKMQGKQVENVF